MLITLISKFFVTELSLYGLFFNLISYLSSKYSWTQHLDYHGRSREEE